MPRPIAILAAAILLSACNVNNKYDPAKPHHTPEGFRNNYPHDPPGSFWKWQYERWRDGLPKEPADGYRPDVATPDLGWLSANRGATSITWIGHATFLVQMGGLNILTDPVFSERASPVQFLGPRRRVPPAIPLRDLPHIDLVVVSHNHYDHLDHGSVVALNAQPGGPPRFLVPLGLQAWFANAGIATAEELDWWESRTLGAVQANLVPVQHWSARTRTDRNETLWGGWLIEHAGFRFFFAGDTGYSADFQDIRARFGDVDVAALPIGAYEPRWFMKWSHINPDEAVRIHQDLGAKLSIAMHWGTFVLTDEPLDEPPKHLATALAKADVSPQRFRVLKFGETLRFPTQGR